MTMDIASLYLNELQELLRELGEPAFRAKQLFSWLHAKQVTSYDAMTDLPASLREKLTECYPIPQIREAAVQISRIDGTRKYLFALEDGNCIESVWMRYHHGNSVCVSSQVGCRMGCRFCASALHGLVRNLSAGEMLGQVYGIRRSTGESVDSVVIMGSGEPLENYAQTVRFIRLLTDPAGAGLRRRGITLSTCGLVPEIRQLAEEDLAITLAVSLHAATDEKRRALMPIARRYPLRELLDACRVYFERTGRRITFEYALIAGENDGEEDAMQLARLLADLNCHVNLIPVNPVRERHFQQAGATTAESFHKKLEKYGINGTIRRELGRDIDAACGQLRNRYLGASVEGAGNCGNGEQA